MIQTTKDVELREESIKYWQAKYEIHPSDLGDIADWWLSKISSLKQSWMDEVLEVLKETKYEMHVDEYLKFVKQWDGKDFDVPFDRGYQQALSDIKSALANKI